MKDFMKIPGRPQPHYNPMSPAFDKRRPHRRASSVMNRLQRMN